MAVQKGLRRLGRIGLHKTAIAVRQIHAEEVHLLPHSADDRHGFPKIHLCMTRRVGQRHEHLPVRQLLHPYMLLHRRVAAPVAMFIAQPLEDPHCRVPLLDRRLGIIGQYLIDDRLKRHQHPPHHRLRPPIARRFGKAHHLLDRSGVFAKPAGCLPDAQSLMRHSPTYSQIGLHPIHLPALRSRGPEDLSRPADAILFSRADHHHGGLPCSIFAKPHTAAQRRQ